MSEYHPRLFPDCHPTFGLEEASQQITSARKGGTISPLGEHVYGTGEYIPMLIIPDEGYVINRQVSVRPR